MPQHRLNLFALFLSPTWRVVYRQSVVMGRTTLSAHQVSSVLRELQLEWLGDEYHL